ncbi:MAG: alpha/beta hydrolase [Microscillaceae bacterium]|nr:alpha/beta hydrolase [Microscillaceae bacterium]
MVIHADYPYPVRRMFLDGGPQLAYIEVGKGPETLLFVHGITSYLPVWSRNIDILQKYYRCIALDLPGHGLSEMADFEYSQVFYQQVLEKFVEKLGLSSFILVGHSMGGQISIHLALQRPELVQHLVLVAPAGFETFSEAEKFMLEQFMAAGVLAGSQYLRSLLNLKNYFYDLSENEYTKLGEFSRDFYSLRDNPFLPQVLARSTQGMLQAPVFAQLKGLKMPVLVLFGKNDQLIPNRLLHPGKTEDIAQAGAAQIPQAQLKLYDQCGHFLQYERAARFNIDLYKFLNPRVFGE